MNITKDIFSISTSKELEQLALNTFKFQYINIKVYREFCDYLKIKPEAVTSISKIPFLPIQFFKSHTILEDQTPFEKVFSSSGTTGSITSKHYIKDLNIYKKSYSKAFQQFIGQEEDLCILALLPSYLEREDSSLIYMVNDLIEKSNHPKSGFYLDTSTNLIETIEILEKTNQKTLLIGVSYALLDLIELQIFQLKHTKVMETGGMKGRRKEMVKEELHEILKKGFGVSKIYSEYGMTELLSQAYSMGDGIFNCPPWMKVLTRDPEDALSYVNNKTGGINVIDLANIYSCSFIATQDLGKVYTDGSFEIMGRFDESDIRGCNLMVY